MPAEEWRPVARPNEREKTDGHCLRCGRPVYVVSGRPAIAACWGCDETVGDCYCPELTEAA